MALDDIEVFVHVVRAGSFSGAARELGVSKSHTSKRVSQLEDRLGARLLHRTTRRLTLTDVGRSFFERSARILEELEEAEAAISHMQSAPRGVLRLSAPMSFGVDFVAPAVSEFMAGYPELRVNMQLSDRKVDLIEEGFDLAIRIGELTDSSLIARKLAPTMMYVLASPDYLAEHGRPEHPDDLSDHACLLYTLTDHTYAWRFANGGGDVVHVQVEGSLEANNGEALMQAAIAGRGIVRLPDFIAAPAIRQGKLVPLLPGWSEWSAAVWVLYPHKRHLSPKVRVFVDYLVERWSERPPWMCTMKGGGADGRAAAADAFAP